MMDNLTRAWMLRPWTRTDSIRTVNAQRTRSALANQFRHETGQLAKETDEILTGAYALAAMPLACKLN